MLSSEDAFSYAIARTENLVQTVSSKPTLAGDLSQLMRFRSSSGPKKIIDVGPMKVNSLATLVLDCEFATKKGSESHAFLEGKTVFRP